ncbi:MAG: tRNA (adenosine(37)-N6)-threonylcarbamoyltransferase complex dimerization subunit type 1 TsaB [Candidatus Ozemobacteraceae bacterium]
MTTASSGGIPFVVAPSCKIPPAGFDHDSSSPPEAWTPSYVFLDASNPRIIGQIGFRRLKDKTVLRPLSPPFQSFAWDSRQDFAARLTAFLDEMLAATGEEFSSIDCLGVCIGPGSLTGVRTAVAFMRTLSYAVGKPLLGVSLFDWAAASLATAGEIRSVRLSVPALRDKVFALDLEGCLEQASYSGAAAEKQLKFILRSDNGDGRPHFGIRHGDDASDIIKLEPTPEALHRLMIRSEAAVSPNDFEGLLRITPLYVIPSLAEINLEKRG